MKKKHEDGLGQQDALQEFFPEEWKHYELSKKKAEVVPRGHLDRTHPGHELDAMYESLLERAVSGLVEASGFPRGETTAEFISTGLMSTLFWARPKHHMEYVRQQEYSILANANGVRIVDVRFHRCQPPVEAMHSDEEGCQQWMRDELFPGPTQTNEFIKTEGKRRFPSLSTTTILKMKQAGEKLLPEPEKRRWEAGGRPKKPTRADEATA